jgi:hypothetical protein
MQNTKPAQMRQPPTPMPFPCVSNQNPWRVPSSSAAMILGLGHTVMSGKLIEQKASVEKTQRHLEKLTAKADLTEKEIKRQVTYSRRLEKKQAEVAQDMALLEVRKARLEATMALEAKAIQDERQAAETIQQEAQDTLKAAHAAKATYEKGVTAIEAVLTEAENETLGYSPDTGKTTMKDPSPLKTAPKKLRTQIVKLAKRLAFVESNLFARIFRLNAHIDQMRSFLTREDISADARRDAQETIEDVAQGEPSHG